MALAFQKFHAFVEALAEGKHNLGSDTLKMMLTNVEPDPATDALKSDITEIGAGNGYTAGGAALTVTESEQEDGTYALEANDLQFTTSGGTIGPFQWIVLYNDTATDKNLIGFWEIATETTLTAGQSVIIRNA